MATEALVKGSWFREVNEMWSGYAVSLEVEEVLVHEKSDFQDILVFKSKSFGNVLVLDGVIQCTERDEFTYQEMISHLPLNSHPNPKKVLVIGGGDGGVVREVLKYPSVDQVVLCEIDERVVEVCKQHLPSMASCLSDPRAVLHIGDGIKYLQQHKGEFDVIITDAPDPIGPAEGLYQKEYYENLKKSLKPNGIISCQGETLWFDLPLIKQMISYCRDVFPTVAYASGNTPTYPGGHMGFLLCSTNPSLDLKQPQSNFSSAQLDSMGLKYYSPEIHRAAFALLAMPEKPCRKCLTHEELGTSQELVAMVMEHTYLLVYNCCISFCREPNAYCIDFCTLYFTCLHIWSKCFFQ